MAKTAVYRLTINCASLTWNTDGGGGTYVETKHFYEEKGIKMFSDMLHPLRQTSLKRGRQSVIINSQRKLCLFSKARNGLMKSLLLKVTTSALQEKATVSYHYGKHECLYFPLSALILLFPVSTLSYPNRCLKFEPFFFF